MNRDPDPLQRMAGRAGVATLDRPCADCLKEAEAPTRARPSSRRAMAFWIVGYLFATLMLGTTLRTQLYVIYEAQWHFSSGITTVIFASYAVGVLAALLLAGRSSDQVGRRPVLFAALVFSAVSTVVFIVSPATGWLFVGRVLSWIRRVFLVRMFTALAPSFLSIVLHERSHAVGGAVVFALFGAAAATQLLLARSLPGQ